MKKKMAIFRYIILIILTLWYSYGYAYQACQTSGGTDIKWNTSYVTYYINTSGGPSGCLSAIQGGMNTWTNVSTSSFTFYYGGTTTSTAHGTNDGTNIVTFGGLGSGILAENSYWYYTSTGYVIDSDIKFNTNYTWGTTGSASDYDVQNIGTHEHGHSLCLADLYSSADSEKTMYGYGSAGETKKRTLEDDDIAGIAYLYSLPPSCPELYSWNGEEYENNDHI
ncbi:MAG: matrixin family metalloprotease, partial [Desulfobacteraceae bacterium]|nr:matrixin family metalloprotease [Desulfobacteraceae bacterium]